MGYRSDIRIITTERGVAEIGDAVREGARERGELAELWNSRKVIGTIEDIMVLLAWDDIKWYEDFGAELIEEAVRNSKEPCRLVRLGEEVGDFTEITGEKDVRPIYWRFDFLDAETLGRAQVHYTLDGEEMAEVERVAETTGKEVREILNELCNLYRANLYEDLKDIQKGDN